MLPSVPPDDPKSLLDRRRWLWCAASSLAALPLACRPASHTPTTAEALSEELLRFPGKVPMRCINHRPPCLETPWRFFREDLTPNEAFFVRWHLQVLPTTVDVRTWRLRVHGEVDKPCELSLDDLKKMEPTTIVAVCQCSGNSRSFFQPQVPGAQWRNGAMSNARWTGVAVHEVLRRARLKSGAAEVAFHGLDRGGLPTVPDFVKSLPIDQATGPEPLLAYEMNGQPLPLLNGFPLRLIVPGWYSTYWVKSLGELAVLPQRFDGYWMAKAYRIPTTSGANEDPKKLTKETVPISRMNLRSFFTAPDHGTRLRVGNACILEGIAFDGGAGIKRVQVSTDDGATWANAELGTDLGRFSFRRWRYSWQPEQPGPRTLRVRALSTQNEEQPAESGWNRSGFMRNVIEMLPVNVA